MKKILLVGGCSFTDSNFRTLVHPELDVSFPKWPEIIAKKLDMQLVNLAFSGAGQEQIYSRFVDYINENGSDNIGLAIAAWSQCQRRDYQTHEEHFKSNRDYWRNERVDEKGDVFYWTKKSLRYFISFQNLCELHKIPYKQFSMLSLFQGWLNGLNKRDTEIADYIRNPKGLQNFVPKYKYPGDPVKDCKKLIRLIIDYEKSLNTHNFIGWPTIKQFGGYYIEEKTIRDHERKAIPGLVISEIDGHPTGKGHKVIAEFINDRLG